MLVIGLTGGIGTGKTEIAHILRGLGATVIEADKVAHLSYRPTTKAFEAIVNRFGSGILDDSGVIDRSSLGAIVFSDPVRREELEAIVWPATREWIEGRLAVETERGTKVVVIEVPKLFEAGWDRLVDVAWTVEAPNTDIGKRVQSRSGLDLTDLAERIAAQMSIEDRIERSDLVIRNNGTLEELRDQVKKAWENIPAITGVNPE